MPAHFELAVREHGPTVLRVCRALLGPGADADDAWSEAFLAALRAWDSLGPDVNLQAWLVRVARNKCVDIVRSGARRATPVADVPERGDGGGAEHSGPALWAAVAELPERQRLAVALHYFGGLTHAETAAETGSTPAAVRRASSDGIAALRRMFSGEEGLRQS